MRFNSTRNNKIRITSAQAITKGLSSEGGLFVPEDFPTLSSEEIMALSGMSYSEAAFEIIGKYLTDFSESELKDCIAKAYTVEKFGSCDIAPLHTLENGSHILELWHGPTCAFKDMALQILPHLLTVSAKKCGEDKTILILVATSGDTGKAALEGFCDVAGTKIAVFYPENGVSDIQKRQMITQEGNNVYVTAVKGNFDDAQTGVKKIFTDDKYKKILDESGTVLSSANSINFGRLVPQIVYYFYAYSCLLNRKEINKDDKINFVVPTGNFGNILAAYYAKKMGLNIGKLICASNSNNVLTDFIRTGTYDRKRPFNLTLSPSMDILISSNLERLIYTMSGKNDALVSEYMVQLEEQGKYTVDERVKKALEEEFYGGFCDDKKTTETIGEVFGKYEYLIDTHTAVAYSVYKDYVQQTGDKTPSVIVSTASPYKFAPGVLKAVGGSSDGADGFEILEILSRTTNTQIPEPLYGLKNKKIRFTGSCEKQNMKDQIDKIL